MEDDTTPRDPPTPFVIIDVASGNVLRSGTAPLSDIESQWVQEGESLVLTEEYVDAREKNIDPETGEFIDRVIGLELKALKAGLRRAADAEFDRQIGFGYDYGGKNFQTDDASRNNINGVGALAILANTGAVPWPSPGYNWICTDNTYYTFTTASEFITFGVSVAGRYTALRYAFRAIKNAIAALATTEDAQAFDVTQGWP